MKEEDVVIACAVIEMSLGITEGWLLKHYRLGTLADTHLFMIRQQVRIASLENELARLKAQS